jgi:hypothetical protein
LQQKNYPDIPYRVIDLLLLLSGNLFEANIDRVIPENNVLIENQSKSKDANYQEIEMDDIDVCIFNILIYIYICISIYKLLEEWGKFESSSSDDEIIDE